MSSFAVHFKPAVDRLEVNSGELITEQAGYIPPKKQIEDMILAGQRLNESRASYDWDDEEDIDESASDPTRSPNFDLADATQQGFAVDARLKASQKAQDQRTADEAARKAQEDAIMATLPSEATNNK
nr:MAG: hypothetical protein [Microviridae sp.]